ncbi:MAG: response regulator [Planctomycetes bacterium]|nr:response regulator [Planctomycetota bacterium]
MNCKVLIVDDSPLLRATARRAVLQAGVAADNIREAQNGQEALNLLAAARSDIVLLDINMPVMDGYEFVQRKSEDPSLADVKVALVTTEGNRKRLDHMTSLGVTHYLRKPFEPEDLRELVHELFGGSGLGGQ